MEKTRDIYELRKCRDLPHFGEYMVAHHWADGCTVQYRYFGKGAKGKAAAMDYLRNHRGED